MTSNEALENLLSIGLFVGTTAWWMRKGRRYKPLASEQYPHPPFPPPEKVFMDFTVDEQYIEINKKTYIQNNSLNGNWHWTDVKLKVKIGVDGHTNVYGYQLEYTRKSNNLSKDVYSAGRFGLGGPFNRSGWFTYKYFYYFSRFCSRLATLPTWPANFSIDMVSWSGGACRSNSVTDIVAYIHAELVPYVNGLSVGAVDSQDIADTLEAMWEGVGVRIEELGYNNPSTFNHLALANAMQALMEAWMEYERRGRPQMNVRPGLRKYGGFIALLKERPEKELLLAE